jgi:hypothetical protein
MGLSSDDPVKVCDSGLLLIITLFCSALSVAMVELKLYDVSEAGCASVIRYKEGKGSYSAALLYQGWERCITVPAEWDSFSFLYLMREPDPASETSYNFKYN